MDIKKDHEIKVDAPSFSEFCELYSKSHRVRGLWGFVPSFLSLDDPESAIDQIIANYPGTWIPSEKASLEFFGPDYDHAAVMKYPGDPDLAEIDRFKFRHEIIILFPHEFVAVVDPDLGTYEVSRLD